MVLKYRYLPAEIPVITNMLKREPHHTLQYCKENDLLPVCIYKRDEFNFNEYYVIPRQFSRFMIRQESHRSRPFFLDTGDSDPIKVTLEELILHPYQKWPMKVYFNRFIEGRPNPLRLPTYPVNMEACEHYNLGANMSHIEKSLNLWTYSCKYIRL